MLTVRIAYSQYYCCSVYQAHERMGRLLFNPNHQMIGTSFTTVAYLILLVPNP